MPDINKISEETRRKLFKKSVKGMAINPSEKGANSKQVQDALVDPYIGENNSLISEVNRIVDETNDKIASVKQAIDCSEEQPADVYNGKVWFQEIS